MSENQYGIIRDGKVYRKELEGFPEKEIGEVKDTEEAALEYYEQRFRHLEEKINQLEQDIHATSNKGSYLMKLLHRKETLADYDGLGDFPALYQKLEALEAHIQETINHNRKRNLEIKTALLAEGEQLQQVSNWKAASEFAKDLKMRWLKTGSLDAEHQEAYEEKFNALINDFFERRNAFYEDRNQMMNERVEQYQALIEKARQLAQNKPAAEAAEGVKAIQAEWKMLGQVPGPKRTELWNEFQSVVKPVFASLKKQSTPSRRFQQQPKPEVLNAKRALLEKLQAIDEKDKEATKKAQQLQEEFKNLGFTGGEGAINDDFFRALGLIKEKQFLHKLAQAKTRDFADKDEKEMIRVKLRLLRDLLGRDERELQNFRENLASLNTGKNRINKMMDSKLRMQEKKVEVKRLLQEELQQQLKE